MIVWRLRIGYVIQCPELVMRRQARVPRLFHLDTCKTNAGTRAPLRRLTDIYNTQFSNIDIFLHSKNSFKKKVNDVLFENTSV